MSLVFRRSKSTKMTSIFLEKIFVALKHIMFYITCNTSTCSISVPSNYAVAFSINFFFKIVLSSFVSLILITVIFEFFAINLISSICDKIQFTFICKKCNPFLSNTFQLRPSLREKYRNSEFFWSVFPCIQSE